MIEPLSGDPGIERRAEPRVPISSHAWVRPFAGDVVRSRVVDVSASGLRIRYSGKGLEVGSQVDVIYPHLESKATVAWTARSEQWVETGLYVTPEVKEGSIDLVQLLSTTVPV